MGLRVKSFKMRTVILQLLLATSISGGADCESNTGKTGCSCQQVKQSGPQTVDRGSSVKLSCNFSLSLQLQKPSLTWIKVDENKVETRIYPSDQSSDSSKFYVDSEAFKISMDAGILLSSLRGRDSGLYVCSVTILCSSMLQDCRGGGTYLTVQATTCDKFIACLPLGVFIATLLVLHGLVYKQWMEHRRVDISKSNKRTCRIRIPRVSFNVIDFISILK